MSELPGWIQQVDSEHFNEFLDAAVTYKALFVVGSDSEKVEAAVVDLTQVVSRSVHQILVSSDQVEKPVLKDGYLSHFMLSEDVPEAQALRAAIRCDPDIIFSSRGELEAFEMYFNMASTGHGVVVGLTYESINELISAIEVVTENTTLASLVPQIIPFVLDLDTDEAPRVRGVQRFVFGEEGLKTEPIMDKVKAFDTELMKAINPTYTEEHAPKISVDPAYMSDWPEAPGPILEVWDKYLGDARRVAHVPTLEQCDSDGAAVSGYFLRPLLLEGEEWPVCSEDSQPMRLVLQMKLADAPEALQKRFSTPNGVLQFFYYTGCEGDYDAWKPFSPASLVRVIDASQAKPAAKVPEFNDYNPDPEEFQPTKITGFEAYQDVPNWEERETHCGDFEDVENGEFLELGSEYISDREYEIGLDNPDERANLQPYFDYFQLTFEDYPEALKRFHPYPGHKVLGWPNWTQGVEYPTCPRSGEKMEMIWQITADSYRDIFHGQQNPTMSLFAADGTGFLFQSPKHPEVLAFGWAC